MGRIESSVVVGKRLRYAGSNDAPSRTRLPDSADAVIVGAGVIGLSIGWQLARAGLSVVVVDRGAAGDGGSLAATGMLAAAAEYEIGGERLLPFATASQKLWVGFARDLEDASGIAIDYDRRGTLVLALTRDEVERLRARHALHSRVGLKTGWLSGPDARKREPSLRPSVAAALFCADDFQVDPRRVLPALRSAVTRAGGVLVEHCSITEIDLEGGCAKGVVSEHGRCRAPVVIVASGAWADAGGLLPPGLHTRVRPLKGQALALLVKNPSASIRHVVWTEQIHLAPKSDGRLIVGATVEECGFDPSMTAGGVLALLEGARRVLPSIEDCPIEAIWSGFRPTSEDDAPIIGETDMGGLLLAVGHHRNGILLSPATASAIVRITLGQPHLPESGDLTLSRFGRSP